VTRKEPTYEKQASFNNKENSGGDGGDIDEKLQRLQDMLKMAKGSSS